jgi:hypothetical protein
MWSAVVSCAARSTRMLLSIPLAMMAGQAGLPPPNARTMARGAPTPALAEGDPEAPAAAHVCRCWRPCCCPRDASTTAYAATTTAHGSRAPQQLRHQLKHGHARNRWLAAAQFRRLRLATQWRHVMPCICCCTAPIRSCLRSWHGVEQVCMLCGVGESENASHSLTQRQCMRLNLAHKTYATLSTALVCLWGHT